MPHNHDFINFSLLSIRQAIEFDTCQYQEADWRNICNAFTVFSESLINHMNNEDSNCFNRVNENTECNPLFYRLISDHIEIRKLIDKCQLLISSNERLKFSTIFKKLDEKIEEHSIREENLMKLKTENLEVSTIKIIELLRNIHIKQAC